VATLINEAPLKQKTLSYEYHLTTEKPVPAVFDVSGGIYISTHYEYA